MPVPLKDPTADGIVICTDNYIYGKGCGAQLNIKDLVYIQTHHYVYPHGCTGGDYWVPSEGLFNCTECGHLNRLYDRPEIENRKHDFKCVEDHYPPRNY